MVRTHWRVERFGKVATLQRGFDLPHRLRKAGTVPIVTSSGIEDLHCEAKVRAPGVVTGRYGTIGEVFFLRHDFWPLNTTLYVRDFHGNDPLFVSYLLRTIDFHTHSGKSGVPGVNRNDLHEIEVTLPPTNAEQEAIAEALSDADALIESLEQLLAKKRQLKQGAMQELLTGKMRLPGFGKGGQQYRATKFGKMPVDWMPTSLERVSAFITKGSTPTTYGFAWQSEGVLFLRSQCVSERGLDFSQSMLISNKAHQVLRRSEVRAGDILMTITGNVGRVVRLGSDFTEANINQHIARIRIVESQVAGTFIFHFLSQPLVRRYYNLITTGQAYPQISLTQVRETEVPMPSFAEQTAIAAILSHMDAEIAALEAKLAKARWLKQGMMQELLTGRIRLV